MNETLLEKVVKVLGKGNMVQVPNASICIYYDDYMMEMYDNGNRINASLYKESSTVANILFTKENIDLFI